MLQLEKVLLLENAEIDLGDLRLCCSFGNLPPIFAHSIHYYLRLPLGYLIV